MIFIDNVNGTECEKSLGKLLEDFNKLFPRI